MGLKSIDEQEADDDFEEACDNFLAEAEHSLYFRTMCSVLEAMEYRDFGWLAIYVMIAFWVFLLQLFAMGASMQMHTLMFMYDERLEAGDPYFVEQVDKIFPSGIDYPTQLLDLMRALYKEQQTVFGVTVFHLVPIMFCCTSLVSFAQEHVQSVKATALALVPLKCRGPFSWRLEWRLAIGYIILNMRVLLLWLFFDMSLRIIGSSNGPSSRRAASKNTRRRLPRRRVS